MRDFCDGIMLLARGQSGPFRTVSQTWDEELVNRLYPKLLGLFV